MDIFSKQCLLSCDGNVFCIHLLDVHEQNTTIEASVHVFSEADGGFTKTSLPPHIIAQKNLVIHSAHTRKHVTHGCIQPFVLLGPPRPSLSSNTFYLLYLTESNIVRIGSFNLSASCIEQQNVADIISNDITSALESYIRNVMILDGPCICFTIQNQFVYSLPLGRQQDIGIQLVTIPIIISTEDQLYESLETVAYEQYIISVGRCRKKQLDISSNDECDIFAFYVNIDRNDMKAQKVDQYPLMKKISGTLFFPEIYDSIAQYLKITFSPKKLPRKKNDDTDVIDICIGRRTEMTTEDSSHDFSQNMTYLYTVNQQLLIFKNGSLLEFINTALTSIIGIHIMETTLGYDYLIVQNSKDQVAVVKSSNSDICCTLSDTSHILVDDFLGKGYHQLVALKSLSSFSNQSDIFLTDFEGLQITEKSSENQEQQGREEETDTYLSAAHAFQDRIQMWHVSLRDADHLSRNKGQLIQDCSETVQKMGLQGFMKRRDRTPVTLVGLASVREPSSEKDLGTAAKFTPTPACTNQRLDCCRLRGARSAGNPASGPRVSHVWHKLLGGMWVVGVDVHNTSGRTLRGARLSLIGNVGTGGERDGNGGSSWKTYVMTSSPGEGSEEEGPGSAAGSKRRRVEEVGKGGGWGLRGALRPCPVIHPGDSASLVAVTPIPETSSALSTWRRLLLLRDSSPGGPDSVGVPEPASGGHLGPGPHHAGTHITRQCWGCRAVELTTADRLGTSANTVTQEQLQCETDLQRVGVSLDCLQQVTGLVVWSPTHRRTTLRAVCQALGFVSALGGYVCTQPGPIQWVRVAMETQSRMAMQIQVATRGNAQLQLFVHALYSVVPDDVIILPAADRGLVASAPRAIGVLRRELQLAARALRHLLASGDSKVGPGDSKVGSGDLGVGSGEPEVGSGCLDTTAEHSLLRKSFQGRRRELCDDVGKANSRLLEEFWREKATMESSTDTAMAHLANCKAQGAF